MTYNELTEIASDLALLAYVTPDTVDEFDALGDIINAFSVNHADIIKVTKEHNRKLYEYSTTTGEKLAGYGADNAAIDREIGKDILWELAYDELSKLV